MSRKNPCPPLRPSKESRFSSYREYSPHAPKPKAPSRILFPGALGQPGLPKSTLGNCLLHAPDLNPHPNGRLLAGNRYSKLPLTPISWSGARPFPFESPKGRIHQAEPTHSQQTPLARIRLEPKNRKLINLKNLWQIPTKERTPARLRPRADEVFLRGEKRKELASPLLFLVFLMFRLVPYPFK